MKSLLQKMFAFLVVLIAFGACDLSTTTSTVSSTPVATAAPASTPTATAAPAPSYMLSVATNSTTATGVAVYNKVTATATCPGGTTLIGGGYALATDFTNAPLLFISDNYPSSASAWTVTAYLRQGTESSEMLTTKALCITLTNATIAVSRQSAAAPGSGAATVACPGGAAVLSGGYSGSDNSGVHLSKQMGNGWQTSNGSPGMGGYTIYALCATGNLHAASAGTASTVSVAGGSVATSMVGCAAGQIVTGGGFSSAPVSGSGNLFVPDASGPTAMLDNWSVQGSNSYTGGVTMSGPVPNDPIPFNASSVCTTLS